MIKQNQLLQLNIILLGILLWFPLSTFASGTLNLPADNNASPEFKLVDLNNKVHRLSDYQGKVVLVNFWASWCPPCIKELPSMQRLTQAFTDQPFKTLAINVSEPERKVIQQARRLNMTFKVLLDTEGKIFKQWQAKVLPSSFIIDKKGTLRYYAEGPVEWDSDEILLTVKNLLQE